MLAFIAYPYWWKETDSHPLSMIGSKLIVLYIHKIRNQSVSSTIYTWVLQLCNIPVIASIPVCFIAGAGKSYLGVQSRIYIYNYVNILVLWQLQTIL